MMVHNGIIVSSRDLEFSLENLRVLLKEGKWNEARDYCLKHIDNHEKLCISLVGIYQHLNNYQKSLEMVSKVKMLKDYSNSNVLKYSAAFGEYKAYMALKDFEKAKSVCEYFISIVPDEKVKLDGTNMKQEAKADLEEINRFLNSKSSQNAKEQEYLDNLKDFLEDEAEITPRERKMLNRIRLSLGISEERAAELEASLKPQLTDDEQEYLDMYHEYAEKGEITEKERRRLDKFAAALGISEERVNEILKTK